MSTIYTTDNFVGAMQPARTTTVATISSLTTTPYGIGDVVNADGLIVLDNVSPMLGIPRRLVQVRLIETRASGSNVGGDFRLWFYRDTWTIAAQNAALTYPSDNAIHAGNILTTSLTWSSYSSTYGEAIVNLQGTNAREFTLGDGKNHLFLLVEARDAKTYASGASLRLEFTWE